MSSIIAAGSLPRATLEAYSNWTGFAAAIDSRVIYVSAAGSNSNNGLSEAAPKLTIAAGKALMRHGYGDWLLLRKGDTFTEPIGQWKTSGKSATQPQLIGSYGTGARPIIRTGTSSGIFTNLGGSSPSRIDYVALTGVEMFPHLSVGAASGNGVMWTNASDGFLIEDCYIHDYFNNVVVEGQPSARITNFKLRRSVIADAHNVSTGHSQGLYVANTDGVLVEDCVFDSNGWKASVVGSVGTIFRHNVYLQDNNSGVTFRRNIVNGTDGVQIRTGGVATDNLFTQTAIALLVRGGSVDVRRNVVLDGANIIDVSLTRGIGINLEDVSAGVVSQNLIANNVDGDDPRPLIINGEIGSGIKFLAVTSNMAVNWGGSVRFLGNRSQLDGLTFSGNDVKNDVNTAYLIEHTGGHAFLSSNNRFFSDLAAAGAWFEVSSVDQSLAQWKAAFSDTTSVSSAFAYPDDTVSTASYSTAVGGLGTHADFIAKCRAQSKDAWNEAYTAQAVCEYIHAGFGLAAG
jgi:hypothetical protein